MQNPKVPTRRPEFCVSMHSTPTSSLFKKVYCQSLQNPPTTIWSRYWVILLNLYHGSQVKQNIILVLLSILNTKKLYRMGNKNTGLGMGHRNIEECADSYFSILISSKHYTSLTILHCLYFTQFICSF